jgi:serine/threonine-protein phosphatase 5
VEKICNKRNFERAMTYDADTKSVTESLNIDAIVVDAEYDGVRWDDDEPISLAFVQDMMERFEAQKKIHRKYAYKLMLCVKTLFEKSQSLVDITIPRNGLLTVCGDVHGQYYDLLTIFRNNGMPSEAHVYLFNGDFVDRGSFSAEVILTLFAFKALYPDRFFLSRGNHETDDMNRVYGFEGEIRQKYSDVMFKFFSEIFNAVPLGNVIENRIFVVHGGLFSRDNVKLQELREIDRFRQPPSDGLCFIMGRD